MSTPTDVPLKSDSAQELRSNLRMARWLYCSPTNLCRNLGQEPGWDCVILLRGTRPLIIDSMLMLKTRAASETPSALPIIQYLYFAAPGNDQTEVFGSI